MQVAGEMGRATIRIERNPDEPGVVSKTHPEPPRGFGIKQPVARFEAELSVPL
jgi:hypothetical protein